MKYCILNLQRDIKTRKIINLRTEFYVVCNLCSLTLKKEHPQSHSPYSTAR